MNYVKKDRNPDAPSHPLDPELRVKHRKQGGSGQVNLKAHEVKAIKRQQAEQRNNHGTT